MENKKFLNEEKYQQTNSKVKKVGKVLLIIGFSAIILGILLLILGFLGVGNTVVNGLNNELIGNANQDLINVKTAFGSFGLFALGVFMISIGSFSTIVGLVVKFISNRREITAYTAQQVIPVGKEVIEETAPSIGVMAEEIVKGIKKGINDSNKEIK